MESIKEKSNIAVTYKNAKDYKNTTDSIVKDEKTGEDKYEYKTNRELLRYMGAALSNSSMGTIYMLATIIMGIVLVSSVFVIKNGFAISVTERLKQYGMLASVGTTKKQIKKSVYFEGMILGLAGIPFGIISGIVAIFILLKVVNIILGDYLSDFTFIYSISGMAILISVLVAGITIYLSCVSSARKAAKVQPIDLIRSSNDIKIKANKIKSPKIISKIFNVGGEIAYKNLKRSKKKYRATIVSLVVSIVIFIAISSFIEYGFKMSNVYYQELGYNIRIYYDYEGKTAASNELYDKIINFDKVEEYSIQKINRLRIDPKKYYSDFAKNVVGISEEEEEDTYISILSIGEEEYKRYIKEIGLKYEECKDSAILIDDAVYFGEEKKVQGNVYNLKEGDTIEGNLSYGTSIKDNEYKDFSIKVAKRTDKRPMGLESYNGFNGYLIVSEELKSTLPDVISSEMYINSKDATKLCKEIENYIDSNSSIDKNAIHISNYEEEVKENNAFVLVVSIFLYGFIAVITAIGVTNIFNTITTNMNLRSKEFANLKSIGMTKKEFNRMIRLESIFYGLKSLIIGVPIGIGLSYLIYKAFETSLDMGYIIPIKSILIAIVFVMLIVGIIMKYSLSKINKQNIIETIRNDNI